MKTSQLIIGVGYRMGVGKDEVANQLCRRGYKVLRFADALKEAACTIFGWKRSDLEDLNFKMTVDEFWGETPRALLQRMGTEAMRNNIRDDVWIQALRRRITASGAERIVIPDVRFVNEAEAVKSWGGYVLKVTRPGFEAPGITQAQAKHSSETEMDAYDAWDGHMVNSGTIAELREGAGGFAGMWEKEHANRRANSRG